MMMMIIIITIIIITTTITTYAEWCEIPWKGVPAELNQVNTTRPASTCPINWFALVWLGQKGNGNFNQLS